MKTLKLWIAGFAMIIASSLQAQVSVNVNIGTPPDWAPAGYAEINYYYLPDIETYYEVRTGNFIYIDNGKWIYARQLPPRYSHYNLYNGYTVVLTDYKGTKPYTYYKKHKVKYHKGYKGPNNASKGKKEPHKKGKGNNQKKHKN